MAKDYPLIAKQTLQLVGGPDNVTHVMHCATRLRFTLKDIDTAVANKDAVKAIPGVIDVIVQNGQYQVCIGPDVSKVFAEVTKALPQLQQGEAPAANQGKKKWSDRFFEVVSGIFTPVVPVLMASGMMGAALTILSLLGVLDANGPTYYVLNIIYDAGFYFLPVFIAYNTSKKLNASPFLSMLLAAIMLHPNITNFSSLGVEQLSVFGISIPTVNYSKTVLPIILGVWLLGYIERFFNKILPDIIRAFTAPVLVMLIMTPIMLIVIGPLGNTVAGVLGDGVIWLGDHLGFVAVALLGFFTPVMIATGTHSFAFPVIVASITTVGYDALLMPSMLAENLAMAGAAFAVGFMSKDVAKRSESVSAGISAILGISEPATYGINLPSMYGFLGAMIGGAIGGGFAGIFGFRMYMIASSSVVGIPAMFGDLGVANVIVGLLTIVISFAAAFAATLLLAKAGIKGPKIKAVQK